MPRKPSTDGSKLLEDVVQLLDDQVVELVNARVACSDADSLRLDISAGRLPGNFFSGFCRSVSLEVAGDMPVSVFCAFLGPKP